MQVVQQGARSVGGVRGVHGSAGQVPNQPAVDGAKGELTACCPLSSTCYMVEDPADLGAREVGVDFQSCALSDVCGLPVCPQLIAEVGGAPVLPDDGVVDGLAGGAVPDHGGFPLVGDADGSDVGHGQSGFGNGLAGGGQLTRQDVLWVVFHPARLGKVLRKFLLRHAQNAATVVEDEAAAAGGALVQGEDVLFHAVGFHLMLHPKDGICPAAGTAFSASKVSRTCRMSAPVTGTSLPGRAPSNCPR